MICFYNIFWYICIVYKFIFFLVFIFYKLGDIFIDEMKVIREIFIRRCLLIGSFKMCFGFGRVNWNFFVLWLIFCLKGR